MISVKDNQEPEQFVLNRPSPSHAPLNIALGFTGTLLLGLLIFFFYQNQQLKQRIAILSVSPSPLLPIPTSSAEVTNGTKTYTNTAYGFAFQYPSAKYQEIDLSDQTTGNDNYYRKVVQITSPQHTVNFTVIQDIDIYDKASPETVAGREFMDRGIKYTIKNFPVGAYKAALTQINKELSLAENIVTIAHPTKNLYVQIHVLGDFVSFDQILSTFRFTGQTSKTTQDQAIQIVRNLPEVKTWIGQVETGPLGGKAVLVPEEGEKDNAWTIHAFEQLPDHNASFNFFYVDKTTGQVTKEFNF